MSIFWLFLMLAVMIALCEAGVFVGIMCLLMSEWFTRKYVRKVKQMTDVVMDEYFNEENETE